MIVNKARWNYIFKHKDNSLKVNKLMDVNQFGSWASYYLYFNNDKRKKVFSVITFITK